ncbi:MAG TPA: DMT family transporter [Rubrivivax sp.]|nr:DMT family transporter [Rubrivivax sp.]
MNAAAMMVLSTLLFATMAVCVKLAAASYGTGTIVFYRGLVGAVAIALLVRARGGTLRTPVPRMHLGRSAAGVSAVGLWFYALGGLPLATATALNYMSSVWMAVFLIGGAALLGTRRVEGLLLAVVLLGFAGVALVLQPSLDGASRWAAAAGLLAGMMAALAYLQLAALGRVGEPEERTVFYFNVGNMVLGGLLNLWEAPARHNLRGLLLLLAIGMLAVAAQVLLTRAYTVGRALVNATLNYLGILFAFVYGVLLFGERVTGPAVAGVLMIVAAGLISTRVQVRARAAEAAAGRPAGES